MAETEEQVAEVAEKIMDLESMEMIDNPDFKIDEGADEGETEEEKAARIEAEEAEAAAGEEGETEEEKAARLEAEENETEEEKEARLKKESEEGETEEERTAREKEEENETEEEKEARLKKEAEDDNEPTFDSLISDKFSEKYEINNEGELDEILANTEKVLNYNEQLKKDLEEAKKQDPVFKSDKDKKAFEFLKQYNVDKFGNGVGNYARLIGIEPSTIDGKLAMQEAFIVRNPELEREDAIELFNDEYEQYSVNRDDFEEEAAYDKKQKLKDIQKKKDVSAARSYLSEQQEKFKSSDDGDGKNNDDDEAKAAKEKVYTKAVAKYSELVDNSLDGFDSLIFKTGEKEEDDFTFKLSKDQLNKIELSMKNYVKSPNIYDEKGEIATFDADETKVNVAMALFGLQIFDEAYKHGITIGNTMKVEKIGKTKPDRKLKKVGGDGDISADDQFEQQAEERKKKRERSNHYID